MSRLISLPALAIALALGAGAPAFAATPDAKIFTDKGCVQCHKVSAYGIDGGETAPDLSTAAADTKARFGVTLDKFLAKPTGTMQMVLGSMIKLSPAERKTIVKLLQSAPKK